MAKLSTQWHGDSDHGLISSKQVDFLELGS